MIEWRGLRSIGGLGVTQPTEPLSLIMVIVRRRSGMRSKRNSADVLQGPDFSIARQGKYTHFETHPLH